MTDETQAAEYSPADPEFSRAVTDVLLSFLKSASDGMRIISGSLSHKGYETGAANRWRLNADGTYDISLLSDVTASAAELNALDGYTGDVNDLNEMEAFFGATDITGAEAEDLTDGGETVLHTHASGFSHTIVAGKAIEAGTAASIESDAELWPCRFTSCTSSSLACTLASCANGARLDRWSRLLDLSDTVKLGVMQDVGAGVDNIYLHRVAVDPASNAFTAASVATLTLTGGVVKAYDWDCQKLTADKAVIAWVDTTGAPTYKLYAKVLDLSSGITEGATLTVDAAVPSGKGVAISVNDAAELFVWYNDNTNGIVATQVTVSGTNLTLGTVNIATADVNDAVRGAAPFGGSAHHACIFDDSSAGNQQVICGSNSGGTMTFGATAAAGLYAVTADVHNMVSVSDTVVCAANNNIPIAFRNTYLRHVSRSGTALTVTPYGGYVGDMDSIGGSVPSLAHFGNGEFALACWRYSALTGYFRMKTLSLDGTAWAEGTALTTGGGIGMVNSPAYVCPLSPSGMVGMHFNATVAYFFVVTAAGNMNSHVGIVEAAAASGATATFVDGGETDDLAGMTAGGRHCPQPGGWVNPNRTFGGRYCGVARSSTTLIIQT
jgi:hypothetical protein